MYMAPDACAFCLHELQHEDVQSSACRLFLQVARHVDADIVFLALVRHLGSMSAVQETVRGIDSQCQMPMLQSRPVYLQPVTRCSDLLTVASSNLVSSGTSNAAVKNEALGEWAAELLRPLYNLFK